MSAKLDWLNGRPYVSGYIGEEPWQWAIMLADGASIRNTDEERVEIPDPTTLEGASLLKVEYDEDGNPTLTFGRAGIQGVDVTAEIQLTAGKHTMIDPHWTGGDEVEPEAREAAVPMALGASESASETTAEEGQENGG